MPVCVADNAGWSLRQSMAENPPFCEQTELDVAIPHAFQLISAPCNASNRSVPSTYAASFIF
jgi:hypothetical protein